MWLGRGEGKETCRRGAGRTVVVVVDLRLVSEGCACTQEEKQQPRRSSQGKDGQCHHL